MSRLVRIAALSVLSLSVAAPPAALPSVALAKPLDGEATPAACLPLGFSLEAEPDVQDLVVTGTRVQGRTTTNAPLAPPPPPPPSPAPPAAMTGNAGVTGFRVSPITPAPPRAETERYPDATPNPVKRTSDQPVSTFSIDVDTASYSNVRRFIGEGRTPPKDAVRVEEMINAFDYDYARPTSQNRPFAVTTAVAASPWAEGRQIVHIGLQGYELPAHQQRPLNLTFLVDVSGSMRSADKLDLAKKAMNLAIDRLRPQDTLAVTYYAEGAGTTLQPTPGDQKLKMRCAVASLRASGGTAGATGMTNAYDQAQASFARDKVNRILMFTDGDFNVGVTDDKRLEEYVADKRGTGVYLSVYGFGRGNYQDARMQAIAQAGNGVAAYVGDLRDARRLFGPAFDKGAFPIADDVKIQVEFNPARVAEWRLIGYETRLLNEQDFNNDQVDAGEVGSGASVTALYEITPVGGPTQIGERRYPDNRIGVGGGDPNGEIGFIQVRYKQPGQRRSDLIQQPLTNRTAGPVSAQPPEATRWALAVAAFGQKLRGDPWMAGDYGWDRILDQAQGARGGDPYGDRAEFVQLVRAAQTLPPQRTP
ncbi:von Willebrand factor type A domain-containing protein [Brevundimonas sp.]|uniref:vWA domain-containing protein n=1 Tax=Brevundimonas sp. TaxID=1871086 RepID=UPI0028971633|nr:von Willebrand factor type A domain-containing protein [Brevundimonas sp.]